MSRLFRERIRDRSRWQAVRRQVIERDGFRCQVCGRILNFYNFEIDHIKPLHKMTEHEDAYDTDNLQTLCGTCHSYKTAKENTKPVPPDVRDWNNLVNELTN